MCCVCNLLCKLISLAISILFIIAVVLLILWGVGVIFGSDDDKVADATTRLFDSSKKFNSY